MQRKMCEINGIRYMSPSVAGDLWGMSYQAVNQACKEKRIVGATKDSSGKWIIPVDTQKPLDKDIIRSFLLSVLAVKNRPKLAPTVDENNLNSICIYLSALGYIDPIDESNYTVTDITLTDEGFTVSTEGRPLKLNWLLAGTTFVQVVASIITIWQTLPV